MGYDELKKLNVEVLSVSTDSVYSHKIWNETELSKMVGHDIPFPMISDQGGAIGTLYEVYDEDGGVNIRGRFLIDPEGIIRHVSVNDLSVGRNPQETLRILDALQTDELCPCNWQKGEEVLKVA